MLNIFNIFKFFIPVTSSIVPLYVAGGMAALSIASSMAGNKQAKANAEAQAKFLLQGFNVQKNNLTNTAHELNRQVGMELTQLKLDALKGQATTTDVLVEKEIAGATAERLYNSVEVQEKQMSNQIAQKAEANMVDIQNQLASAKYSYESGMMQNAINMSNNTTSTLGMAAGGAQAGAQGFMLGKALQ